LFACLFEALNITFKRSGFCVYCQKEKEAEGFPYETHKLVNDVDKQHSSTVTFISAEVDDGVQDELQSPAAK
jgi:hypothetical protein